MIKIVIADDHEIMLEGISSLIKPKDGIKIVGEARNGIEVLNILRETETDIVVLDIEMPEMNGVEATKKIREDFPNIKVLILTMHNEASFIRRIIEAGAQGYILKNKGKEELVHAIQVIYEGGEHYTEEVSKKLISSMKDKKVVGDINFTKREIEILRLIADGDSTKTIAKKLHIEPTTVDTHRRNMIEKTGVKNSMELVKFTVKNGYV